MCVEQLHSEYRMGITDGTGVEPCAQQGRLANGPDAKIADVSRTSASGPPGNGYRDGGACALGRSRLRSTIKPDTRLIRAWVSSCDRPAASASRAIRVMF